MELPPARGDTHDDFADAAAAADAPASRLSSRVDDDGDDIMVSAGTSRSPPWRPGRAAGHQQQHSSMSVFTSLLIAELE